MFNVIHVTCLVSLDGDGTMNKQTNKQKWWTTQFFPA